MCLLCLTEFHVFLILCRTKKYLNKVRQINKNTEKNNVSLHLLILQESHVWCGKTNEAGRTAF